jgi:hypothetical protein
MKIENNHNNDNNTVPFRHAFHIFLYRLLRNISWDETYLQNELDALVLKGLIEELGKDDKGDIQYQISNHSLQWKLE